MASPYLRTGSPAAIRSRASLCPKAMGWRTSSVTGAPSRS